MASRVCTKCSPAQLIPAEQWDKHQGEHKHARENPRHTEEYRRNRLAARARDRHRCVVCGVSAAELRQVGESLEAHHVNGNPADHRLSNLRTVCPEHNPRGGSLPGRGL